MEEFILDIVHQSLLLWFRVGATAAAPRSNRSLSPLSSLSVSLSLSLSLSLLSPSSLPIPSLSPFLLSISLTNHLSLSIPHHLSLSPCLLYPSVHLSVCVSCIRLSVSVSVSVSSASGRRARAVWSALRIKTPPRAAADVMTWRQQGPPAPSRQPAGSPSILVRTASARGATVGSRRPSTVGGRL